MIHDHLSFDDHLKYSVTKIASKIGIVANSTKLVNKNYRIKVYNSIILHHFVSCSSILFLFNATQMDKLQKLQSRALRIILNKRVDTNIRSMLNELNWLNVRQIVTFHILKFIKNMKLVVAVV